MGVCDDCKKMSTEMMIMPNEDEVCRPCLLMRLRKGKEPSKPTPRGRGRPKVYRCDSNGVSDPQAASTSSGETSAASNTEVSSSAIHRDGEPAAHEFTRSAARPAVFIVYTHKEPVLLHVAETDLVKDVVMKLQEGENIPFNIKDAEHGVRYINSFPFRDILPTTFTVESPGGTTTIHPPGDGTASQLSEARENPEKPDQQTPTSHVNHLEIVSPNTNTSDRVTDQLYQDSAPTQRVASAFQSLFQGNFNITGGSQAPAMAVQSLNQSAPSAGIGFNYEASMNDNIVGLQPSAVGQHMPTVADGINRPNAQSIYQPQPNWIHNNPGYLNNSGAASSLLWQQTFSGNQPQSTFHQRSTTSTFNQASTASNFNQGSTASNFNRAAFSNVYLPQHTDLQTDTISSPQDLSSFRPQVLQSSNTPGVETLGLSLNPVRPDVSYNLFEPFGVPLITPQSTRLRSPRPPARSSRSSRSRSPPSRPADLSLPSTSRQALEPSHSTIEVKGVSSPKLTHIHTILPPNGEFCHTVAFDRDGELIHGGWWYDSFGLTSNKLVRRIRRVGDDIFMMVEDIESDSDSDDDTDEDTDTGEDGNTRRGQIGGRRCVAECEGIHVVRYSRESKGDREYRLVFKVCVQSDGACDFTVTSGRLYVTGLKYTQIYDYNSGERLGEVGHPDIKYPAGICSTEDGRVFIMDWWKSDIFSFHIDNPTIRKFSTEVIRPDHITIYKNRLLVLCADEDESSIYILDIDTGKKEAVLPLPECRGPHVWDISVNKSGSLAVANDSHGPHLYKLDM